MKTRPTGPPAKSDKSYDLIRRLGSRRVEVRRAAQSEFLGIAISAPTLFYADLADILQIITGSNQERCHGTRAASALLGLSLLVVVGSALSASITVPISQNLTTLFLCLWAGILLFLIGLTFLGLFQRNLGRRNRRLIECITDIDDLNALPTLIEMMALASPSLLDTIRPPLTRLLLRIRASDGHLLGSLHRTALIRALHSPHTRLLPAPFFVAILQAIAQIGDLQALPIVARLAQGKGIATEHPEVHAAAERCLAQLQELQQRQQAPSLLLRPSESAADVRALLQPATSAPENARHELLHI